MSGSGGHTRRSEHPPQRATVSRDLLVCLMLAVATLAVYWPVVNHDFTNYDDDRFVTGNPHVREGLTAETITWSLTTTHAGNWNPLSWWSHMADCELYGLWAGGHHLTSLILHIANALLLFLLLRRITGHRWRSAFVAALFALHPLHVESVTWIAERKDVLSTLFWIATLWAYASYVERPGIGRYILALLCLVLGLAAKPMLVTVPFVLLLLDYWPLGRFRFAPAPAGGRTVKRHSAGRLLVEKVPFFAFAAAAVVVTFLAQRGAGAMAASQQNPLTMRIGNALVSYVAYVTKMVWPDNLAVFYPHPGFLPAPRVAAAGLLLAAVLALVLWGRRRYPYALVGWLWYMGTLVPVAGLVQVGLQGMADRYTYVPLTGLFMIVAWGVPDLVARFRAGRIVLPVAAMASLLALAVLAYGQVGCWGNSVTLFRHALAVTTANYVAHDNLGEALFQRGELAEAAEHHRAAIQIRPDFVRGHTNLGAVLFRQGRIDEAIESHRRAVQLEPDYAAAHNNLGVALSAVGRRAEARGHYAQALRLEPDFAPAHYNLALELAADGRMAEAESHFAETVRLDPGHANAHVGLGHILVGRGQLEEAIEHYAAALRSDPDFTEAHIRMGDALIGRRRHAEAIDHYTEALRLTPDDAELHYKLGSVLGSQGRTDEAIGHFAEALRIRPDYGEAHNQLGNVLVREGRLGEAEGHFRRAIRIRADHAEAHNNLGMVLARQGRLQEAAQHFSEALRVRPDLAQARQNLERCRRALGASGEATGSEVTGGAADP